MRLGDDDLRAACDVEPFTSGGPGGQHRNKTQTAVRVTHRPTGIVVVARERRSQAQNLHAALARLRERLEARARRPKPRVATRPTDASVRRRLADKRRRAERKRLRAAAGDE